MSIWLKLLPGRIWLWLGAAATVIALVFAALMSVRQDERDDARRRQLEAKDATNKRLKNADTSSGDADADLEWLRARNKRGGRT